MCLIGQPAEIKRNTLHGTFMTGSQGAWPPQLIFLLVVQGRRTNSF